MTKVEYFLVAGGTGGHIFPAVAVAKLLGDNSIIIADKRSSGYLSSIKLNVIYIPIRSTRNKLSFFFSLLPSIFKSIKAISKYRPEKIISFGGYPTIPVLIAAILHGKQIILHEANTILGRTNRLFLPFASKLLAGFPIQNTSKEYTLVGNPTREEFTPQQYNVDCETVNFFVIGGSQGAAIFTEKIPDILNKFSKVKKIKVVQQCKKNDIAYLEDRYRKYNIECHISHFFDNVAEIMKNSHIIISRAGAISISEILAIGRAGIFVPYPAAKDNHQFFNAKFIQDNQLGILIEQKNLRQEHVMNAINTILEKRDLYIQNIIKFRVQNATNALVAQISNG